MVFFSIKAFDVLDVIVNKQERSIKSNTININDLKQLRDIFKLTKEEVVKQLQPDLSLVDKLTSGEYNFDIDLIAKVFDIKGMGRNNLFKWLRTKKILMDNNSPYQKYNDYFKVVITHTNGFTSPKTLVRPKGISFLYKKLS